jgi:Arc/MetJ family transcription regulator
MRTTLDIDGRLLEEARKAAGARTKTEAIEMGLRELLRREATRKLVALFGRVPGAKAPPRRRPPKWR